MNLTSFSKKASVAAVACTVGIMAVSAPAEALQLQGAVSISSVPNSTAVTVSTIDFGPGQVDQGTGDFFSLIGESVTVEDITGLNLGDNTIGPIAKFIDFGIVTLDGKTKSLVFDLLSATITTTQTLIGGGQFNTAHASENLTGLFKFGGQTIGRGVLDANRLGPRNTTTGVNSYEILLAAEPIPTPALLPGLVGMGVAALRRKKDEMAEENA